MGTDSNKRSFKEQRIREITLFYYSLPEVRKAIFDFAKNRETIPRFFEGFGKRPDNFQYESDIVEFTKRGATSFHCSEELWEDPLEISTDFSRKQFDEIRIGWDLLLDIDSPYLEYSKIYTKLLVDTLKFHGIENIGIKFSGSKGFHVIIPWKAFPEEIYGNKTKNMFPEWPRIICQYLDEIIKPKLTDYILENSSLQQIASRTGKKEEDLMVRECVSCNRPSIKKNLITWMCPFCKNEITAIEGHYNNRRKAKCPDCRKELFEKEKEQMFYCESCKINSNKNPELFEEKERFRTEKLIEADLILVAPRHLFRMPYSLHEKTALASIVLDPDKIIEFQITDAKPLKVKTKEFYPNSKPEEAKELLLQALDWKEQKDQEERVIEKNKEFLESSQSSQNPSSKKKSEYKKIQILNPTDDLFPPQIKQLLKGIEHDGRKRALFIILSFFKALGIEEKEIARRINEWNERNSYPLKKGYIQAQLTWYKRKDSVMPPNFNNPIYKDLGLFDTDDLSKQVKNPVNYTVKMFFKKGGRTDKQ
ncbi:hypothetical protein HOD75_04945 [archaeon]|jgi:hypothetical protein|nr:hypothetical protein [archaeon]MBT4242212.1 hypothetical protein [archaeon]MBT4417900.1 hypothetical protein [archaeon]